MADGTATVNPVRLQLSRRKGFNLQALSQATNGLPAVNVGRGPGRKWGNPFLIGKYFCFGIGINYREILIENNAMAVEAFQKMLDHKRRNYPSTNEIRTGLRGRNLACWCKPGDPCHADALLDLANGPACEEACS